MKTSSNKITQASENLATKFKLYSVALLAVLILASACTKSDITKKSKKHDKALKELIHAQKNLEKQQQDVINAQERLNNAIQDEAKTKEDLKNEANKL